MAITRNNHYVPQWYQKGFLNGKDKLFYLDLNPDKIKNSTTGEIIHEDGEPKTYPALKHQPISKCFFQKDLYSTFLGSDVSDGIERMLFGKIDNDGAESIKVFIGEDIIEDQIHFYNFFSYIDAQKIRTPKGLESIKKNYHKLDQNDLMTEMKELRGRHLTIWTEGVHEIVSAKDSDVKFILSDHPVTIYNYASPINSSECIYPDDPAIDWKATQTIFPLDINHCLIVTNLEYAQNPNIEFPKRKRINARNFGNSMVRGDALIRLRILESGDVEKINFIIKSKARRYIAAANRDWLYPKIHSDWSELKEVLLPPSDELWKYSGETYIVYDNGRTHYQDAFGRTMPENPNLKIETREEDLEPNDACGCGSGREYKKCCKDKKENERPSWSELSIRERNIILYDGINDILGFNKGKTWDDVRQSLSSDQVKNIHELFGYLWPMDTDLASLLPKPDKSLRALYTGKIDPRHIVFPVGLTPYFDEIIIQSPFMNPSCTNPEINPAKSPEEHKIMTLKNVSLFMMIFNYIDRGYINFIPDISSFDFYLHKQGFDLARERYKNIQINENELKALMENSENELAQYSLLSLPKDEIRNRIKYTHPDLSEEEVEEVLNYMEYQKKTDPFILLQNNIFFGEGKGQVIGMYMLPNFEMSLFLAQITGAVLLTDTSHRWNEILNTQSGEDSMHTYSWSKLSKHINELKYVFNVNIVETFELKESGKLDIFRATMRKVYSTIQENNEPSDELVEEVKNQVIQTHYAASKEIRRDSRFAFPGKLNYLIPKGGIAHNNVQRLLLSSGQENYLSSAPMAIFAEPYPQ